MANSPLNVSFNKDEYNFYSDHEYEEFLENMKKNLQSMDLNSSKQDWPKRSSTKEPEFLCAIQPANSSDLGKDSSIVIADTVDNTEPKNSSTTEAITTTNKFNLTVENSVHDDENDQDLQFENFISDVKSALERDLENDSSSDSSNDSIENSDLEKVMFEKFLNQMSNRLETNVITSQVLQAKNSLLRSQSLSRKTDQTSHNRSQSASRIPQFDLNKAKVQAELDFKLRHEFYAKQMYQFFNQKVFNNKLPETVLLKWNGQMKSTAGFCKCKRKNNEYSFWIELSPHVITSFDRLQDTLIHEMCHAACWMINHSADQHGPLWKTWADRCNLILPEVKVPTRCHNYELSYAYLLKCTRCAFQ